MKRFLLFSLLSIVLTACVEYKEVTYSNIQKVKLLHFKDGNIQLAITLNINNPNDYTIKLKPSTFDFFLNDKALGKVALSKLVVLDKNKQQDYEMVLEGNLKELAKSGIQGMASLLFQKKIALHLVGNLKVGAKGISKKIPIDEARSISPSELGLGGL